MTFDVNSPSNRLFMQKNVEDGYSQFYFTVLKSSVVFPCIKNEGTNSGGQNCVEHDVKWGDLDGRTLSLPPGANMPSEQALAFHARRSFLYALGQRWCSKRDLPALEFGDPDLMQQFLSDSVSLGNSSGGRSLGGNSSAAGSVEEDDEVNSGRTQRGQYSACTDECQYLHLRR
ncbi:hypothetical protein GPECTOR_8g108 [Gonium pectorale]|uniref:Uncharacterized protein n=1 Tax=Gonium pectorale TaxID=33097 RepID=A0A150GSB1_GONPE|nr:hypothetical protein GPECTOR_8g108 [Gonium pectorale]|eukprot:KXZ52713.1 hypothetical protein GPECTOR_8g108 [Gonium pectorale]